MQLPVISRSKRMTLALPPGSADAALLSKLIRQEKNNGRRLAIITADAFDAQRLLDEIPFFDADLQCVSFPDWETLPYDTFSPHQDLISERLATLWEISKGSADAVLVPATTAMYRLPPQSFLAAYSFNFKVMSNL